jgi:hypothetical protein
MKYKDLTNKKLIQDRMQEKEMKKSEHIAKIVQNTSNHEA